jgi:hypothetical protein
MSSQKFRTGQTVVFVSRSPGASAGPYEIVRCMPADSPDFVYRIKSRNETHERVVREHEIKHAS